MLSHLVQTKFIEHDRLEQVSVDKSICILSLVRFLLICGLFVACWLSLFRDIIDDICDCGLII